MELELEAGAGGSRVVSLSTESPAADLGSGDLVPPADRTVSRRHVSLRLVGDGGEPRVAFEVVGRNPVVVRSSPDEQKAYRRGEAGELRAGDGLSLSLKAPSFWTVRSTGVKGETEVDTAVLDAVARRERRTRERKEKEREMRAVEEAMEVAEEEEETAAGAADEELDEELEDLRVDLENVDPVQEFGFLSMGHEFDNYPKGRIRAPKDWNWFLEEIKKGSDDDEDDDDVSNTGNKSRGGRGVNKMKKKGEDDDEEWTDESEDGKDPQQSGPSVKRPKNYVTRSKDPKKPRNEISKTKNGGTVDEDAESDEEDGVDETLGGFIVKEEDEPMEELSEEEEEEDEFDDEDEDD